MFMLAKPNPVSMQFLLDRVDIGTEGGKLC